jgi:glutathione S-transferase
MAAATATEAKATETKTETPKYELTYFNGRGLGEPARLLFASAGVAFTDVRVEQKDWPTLKPTTPFGQIPTLKVGGQTFGQSGAINRFIARETGQFGASELEALAIDSLVEFTNDLRAVFNPIRQLTDGDDKKTKIEAFFKSSVPAFAAKYIAILSANGGGTGWFVGSKISLADIYIFNTLAYLQEFDKEYLSAYAVLAGLVERVRTAPKIAAYLAARPATW